MATNRGCMGGNRLLPPDGSRADLLAEEAASPHFWRQIHRASFGLYILATVHGIQAGTDTLNLWYRMAMLASINIVAFLTIVLVLAHRKAAPARRAVVSA